MLGLTCLVGGPRFALAEPFEGLRLIYHATFGNGSLNSGVDYLGFGPLKPASHAVPNSDPSWTPEKGDIVLQVTRPADLASGLVSSGLFATPVEFGQGSIFGMKATFVAPQGPHGVGTIFAVVVGATTGSEIDSDANQRAGASLQVRGNGARLNVPGASPAINLPDLPQEIYDAIFDEKNPRPFTLELTIDRVVGQGEASLKVDGFDLVQSVQFGVFKADSGPVITAVGPALAIANGPGQSASVRLRDFQIFARRRIDSNGFGDLCPPEFGCRLWPSSGEN